MTTGTAAWSAADTGHSRLPCGDLAALSHERRPVQEVEPQAASLTG